jgi:hypothetical protein
MKRRTVFAEKIGDHHFQAPIEDSIAHAAETAPLIQAPSAGSRSLMPSASVLTRAVALH